MKNVYLLLFVIVTLVFTGCEKKEKTAEREWTIMGYFNGNNNLDYSQGGSSYIIGDVQEMEHAGASEQVTSIVMLSSLKTGGNSNYYKIEPANDQLPDQVLSPLLEDMGTKDMSDQQTLINFIDYAVKNYPAKHYMLVLNSHGGGWQGVSPDEANGSGDMMSLPDLREALETAPHFDVVVFHACLMSMTEVAYEIKDLADYMVSSEISMPALSVLGADTWLKSLIDNPQQSSFDISKKIVQCVYDNGTFAQKTTHMAVTDLSKMDALSANIGNLGNKLTTETGNYWSEVFDSWNETHYINNAYPAYTDLREFVKKLMQKPGLSQINYITQACEDVLTSYNEAVPFTKCYLENTDQPYGGLTIHFPQQETDFNKAKYEQLKFKKVNWHNFLEIFITNTQGIGNNNNGNNGNGNTGNTDQVGADEVGLMGTITYPGNNISQYCYFMVYEVDNNGDLNSLGYENIGTDGNFNTLITGVTETITLAFEFFDDANNNGNLDQGEGYAFWDSNQDNTWNDILEAKPGNVYKNINATLKPY